MKSNRSIRFEHADILLTDPANTREWEIAPESEIGCVDMEAEALFEGMYCIYRGRLEEYNPDAEQFQPGNALQIIKIYSGCIGVYGPSEELDEWKEDIQIQESIAKDKLFVGIINDFTGTVSCVTDEFDDVHIVGISDDGKHDFFTIEYFYDVKSIRQAKENKNKLQLYRNAQANSSGATPLRVENAPKTISSWAEISAYIGDVKLCDKNIKPQVGDVLDFMVHYPVCSKVGEVFAASGDLLALYDCAPSDKFTKMKLLKIKRNMKTHAIVQAEIIEKGDWFSFVKPVSEEEKERLRKQEIYDYYAPSGDGLADYFYVADSVVRFCNSLGGGDINDDDFVFTDADGIDHLVLSCHRCFGDKVAYYGDKVLGYHRYSRYFQEPEVNSNGVSAPNVPYGFEEAFGRSVDNMGVIPYLHQALQDVKSKGGVSITFNSCDGKYTEVVVRWICSISIEGFVYVLKKVIEQLLDTRKFIEYNEAKRLFNEIVTELGKRSYKNLGLEQYRYPFSL